jgi:CRISPR/Cas system-associated exonuclease Cas4 (RecB family)
MSAIATQSPAAEKKRRGFDHISFSGLSLFQQCPLRFFFRYIEGLSEEMVASSLVFGRSIHSALEFHFEQLMIDQAAPSLDTLLDVFQAAWRSHDGPEIRFGKGEDINTLGRLAERMLRAFKASSLARPDGTILGIEEELRADLVPGGPELLGRVDLLVETEEAIEVTDFKTARSQWSVEHVDEAAPQLLLYSELAKPLSDGKPLKLAFAVITKTQAPALNMHLVAVAPAKVERTKRVVERVWRAIQAGHFYPNPSPINCPTCPYRKACRAWTG